MDMTRLERFTIPGKDLDKSRRSRWEEGSGKEGILKGSGKPGMLEDIRSLEDVGAIKYTSRIPSSVRGQRKHLSYDTAGLYDIFSSIKLQTGISESLEEELMV